MPCMDVYLLDRGIGVAGESVECQGTLGLRFKGASVDGAYVGGRLYPVVNGLAEIPCEGMDGVIHVAAYNSVTRRSYDCGRILAVGDRMIPLVSFTPAEFAAMASEAEAGVRELTKKVKILEEAVFGIPLFGKEE